MTAKLAINRQSIYPSIFTPPTRPYPLPVIMALSTRSGELLKRGAAERFHEAAQALYKVIEKPRYERIKVQFETILTEESRIPELTKLVEGLVEAGLEKTRGHSETSKLIIANIFKSSYPFLRQLLAVGQTGASVTAFVTSFDL